MKPDLTALLPILVEWYVADRARQPKRRAEAENDLRAAIAPLVKDERR
jgi:hypothetical protein